MKLEQRRQRRLERTREWVVAAALSRESVASRQAEPAAVGDLFVLRATGRQPLEWVAPRAEPRGAGRTPAQVVTYPSPETSGLLSPDGKLAFFNSQTGDYTVVDVESNRMVDQIAGGGIRFLDDGKRAVVMQVTDVVLWDVEQRRTIVEIDAGGGGKSVCPDGDHVWTMAGLHSLNVVDLAKRSVINKFDGLGGALLFYDAAPSTATANAP